LGLAGSGLVLRNNGGDDVAVSADGVVTFATPAPSGGAYDVTVFRQPTSPTQSCVVTGGSGTVANGNVSSITIVCTTNTYTVGGTVSGLAGSGLVLSNKGGDDLAVSANGSFTFATPVVSGDYYSVTVHAQPTTPAQTCLVTAAGGTVASANVTTVVIDCVANGTLRVTVSTAGPDAPATYTVAALSTSWYSREVVPTNDTVSLALAPGVQEVSLTVPPNCRVTSPHPLSVTVASGGTTDIVFAVTCVANGTLRVTASTTGPNAPATYTVGVDQDYTGFGSLAVISSNGTVSKKLPPGSHIVELLVPLNCTVASPNNVAVSLTSGATTDLGFTVVCQ
jgi:hypothetical protein